MPAPLAARQRAQTKRELERQLKARDKTRLSELRAAVKAAKETKRKKLREVRGRCKAARTRNARRAKEARAKLRESIARTRERARELCGVRRGEARRETLSQIERAVAALDDERATQRQLAAWTRPTSCAVPRGKKGAERRAESDCEVAANLDDPGLRVVWERVKHKIKPSSRRSRTEAFIEWAHDHAADVYRIQEEDAIRALEQLEREERKLARELKKPARYSRKSPEQLAELLAGVPF